MRYILHIQSGEPREPSLPYQETADVRHERVDLRQPAPDYEELLEKVFQADAVLVW